MTLDVGVDQDRAMIDRVGRVFGGVFEMRPLDGDQTVPQFISNLGWPQTVLEPAGHLEQLAMR